MHCSGRWRRDSIAGAILVGVRVSRRLREYILRRWAVCVVSGGRRITLPSRSIRGVVCMCSLIASGRGDSAVIDHEVRYGSMDSCEHACMAVIYSQDSLVRQASNLDPMTVAWQKKDAIIHKRGQSNALTATTSKGRSGGKLLPFLLLPLNVS
jgi:hypothetical protein